MGLTTTILATGLLVILITRGKKKSLPQRQYAEEINLRICRYLNHRNTGDFRAHLIKGHPMTGEQARWATQSTEIAFEEHIAEIYRNENYYRLLKAFVRPKRILWWTWRPSERQIWKFRERYLGRNSISEDLQNEYRGYMQERVYYTDANGKVKQRTHSDYNRHRLQLMLPAGFYEALEQHRDGLEGINDNYWYINNSNWKELDGELPELPEVELEVGNDYQDEADRLYLLSRHETNTIDLPTDRAPFRPRVLYNEEGHPVAIREGGPPHRPAPSGKPTQGHDFRENPIG